MWQERELGVIINANGRRPKLGLLRLLNYARVVHSFGTFTLRRDSFVVFNFWTKVWVCKSPERSVLSDPHSEYEQSPQNRVVSQYREISCVPRTGGNRAKVMRWVCVCVWERKSWRLFQGKEGDSDDIRIHITLTERERERETRTLTIISNYFALLRANGTAV